MTDEELEAKARLFGIDWDDFKLEGSSILSSHAILGPPPPGSTFCPICNDELDESIIKLTIDWRLARGTILKPEDEKGMDVEEKPSEYRWREPLAKHLQREHPSEAYVFCLRRSLLEDKMTERLAKFKE